MVWPGVGRQRGGGGGGGSRSGVISPTFSQAVEALALEKRVILLAKDVAVLAPCCEALLGLLFPFSWSHVYIPFLPYDLLM